jgi:23S rRNA pseudouridine1911/1915/1917 synthase
MKWVITKEHAGIPIREFLRVVAGLSRRILIAAKSEEGEIRLNGREETVRKVLKTGDVLEVKLPEEKVSDWLYPEELDLSIVYEDDAILVINKQAGVPVLPSPKYPSHTLANGVLAHYEKIGNRGTVHIVTRLDKDTSGLLLIAKNRLSHSLLAKSQKVFGIKRSYLAIVEGKLEADEGKIDAPIGRKPDSIIEREVNAAGKAAKTYYKVVKRFPAHTLVEVTLETGRTHQIRVHFSFIGHPLVGDDLYGGKKDKASRQALHCHKISFPHPKTKRMHNFRINLSDDLIELVERLSTN